MIMIMTTILRFGVRNATMKSGTGYAYCRFYHSYLGYYLICWHRVQTYNSLGQHPCKVAAYLLSTCHGGCELSFLFCLASVRLVVSSLSQRIISQLLARRGTSLIARTASASATPSYIPSSVHVRHAKVESIPSTILSLSLPSNSLAHIFDISYKEYVKYCSKVLYPGK